MVKFIELGAPGLELGFVNIGNIGEHYHNYIAVCQNLVPLVNPKIAGKWMFIPLKMVLIGIDPYPYIITNI